MTNIPNSNNQQIMGTQTEIAERSNIKQPTLANILSGRKRPSWKVAKKLAEVTGTTPDLWLEGTTEDMRKAISSDGQ